MPAEVVLAAGLDAGVELDRSRARRVWRELRRHEATARASRALARRDLSERELTARLARAHVAPAARAEAVERLVRAGAVDDERFARGRAELLAERGAGDALIAHDLTARGISEELVERAVKAVEPESERAVQIAKQRGPTIKTARYLARKGFCEGSIEHACARGVAEEAPPAVR